MNLNLLTPVQDRIAGSLESISDSLMKHQTLSEAFTYNMGSTAVVRYLLNTIEKEKLKGMSDGDTLRIIEERLHEMLSSLKTGIKTGEVVVAP